MNEKEEEKENIQKKEATKEEKTEETQKRPQIQENTIFIGRKPPMNYVLAVITGLSASNVKEINRKARSRAISTAVDVAEITRSRFMKNLEVSKIALGTERMPPREGEKRARMVSTIKITLTRE